MSKANAAAARARALFAQLAKVASDHQLDDSALKELAVLLDAASKNAEEETEKLDVAIAQAKAIQILGLAQAVSSDNDALSDRVTALLVEATSIYRPEYMIEPSWISRARMRTSRKRPVPNPTRSGAFITQLDELEQARKHLDFFPKEVFDHKAASMLSAINYSLVALGDIEKLVLLLAEERRFRRRLDLFSAMRKWTKTPTQRLPRLPDRAAVVESQLQMISQIRQGVERGIKTKASLETLWKWFSQDFKFLTAAVSLVTVTGAYLGVNLDAIKESYSAQIIQAVLAAALCLSVFIYYWIWKSRKFYSSPGLPSLLGFVGLVPAVAFVLGMEKPRDLLQQLFASGPASCESVGEDVECLHDYKMLSDNGKTVLLAPILREGQSDFRTVKVVKSDQILLRSRGVIWIVKPSKAADIPPCATDTPKPPALDTHCGCAAKEALVGGDISRLLDKLDVLETLVQKSLLKSPEVLKIELGSKGFADFGDRVTSLEKATTQSGGQIDAMKVAIDEIGKTTLDTKASVAVAIEKTIGAADVLQRMDRDALLTYCRQRTRQSINIGKKLVGSVNGYYLTESDIKRCVDDWELYGAGDRG